MQEMKDPAIKLFGMTIPVIAEAEGPEISGENSAGVSGSGVEDMNFSSYDTPSSTESYEKEEDKMKARTVPEKAEKDPLSRNLSETKQQDDAPKPMETDSRNQETCSETNENDNPKTPSIDEETATTKAFKTEKEQSEMTSAQEKPLKKPDKIVPCPRCNSMDTKFCYYNNYNVNQPRHFCKSCQRYWTNGGTMRNVPVGAGRRKNKNSVSQYRHITVSEALQAATRIDAPNGVRYPASSLKGDGTVLNFCSDATLSESMASVLNLTEKALWNGKCNGFHKIEEHRKPSVLEISQNGDDHSCGSSLTASNSEEGNRGSAQEPLMPNFNSFPPQISCLPGVPWPYQWNSVVPPPPFYPPGFPPSFYHPAGYWNCAIPGTWNIPWMAALPDQKAPISGPNSPTLGKHSRDGNMLETEREQLPKQKTTPERSIWVPKTLRIDDPEEAAKSSIWATLGIKNDSIRGRGLFKAFQSKGNEKGSIAETSPVLCANPAALSRSLNFHESF